MRKGKYTIGLDFGTLSGRAVLVDCGDGSVLAQASMEYPHGEMDRVPGAERGLGNDWALQHPLDYTEVMESCISSVLKSFGGDVSDIIGIGIDFTSCTLLPIDEKGIPLCLKDKYKASPHAYVKLWKHHAAAREADHINEILSENGLDRDPRFGGRVSPELLLPKVLQILHEDPNLYEDAAAFIEAGDYLSLVLTGSDARGLSMAGYKAWWEEGQGYPQDGFLRDIDEELTGFFDKKLKGEVVPAGKPVGYLSEEWAKRLSLREGIAVASSVIDSHAGFPGSGIHGEGQLCLVLGTSSVLLSMSKKRFASEGILCGQKGCIVPDHYVFESGLASVGDTLGWFADNCVPAFCLEEAKGHEGGIHGYLAEKAEALRPGESGLLALDWFNGNKTPYVDGGLKGSIIGLTLHTKPWEIYRALIEATAFGTRVIKELYEANGARVEEIITSGGITVKNPVFMQIYADVLGAELKVADSSQTASLGSAIYAALAAGSDKGGYDSYSDAVKAMARIKERSYKPNPDNTGIYDRLYGLYREYSQVIGDAHRGLLSSLVMLCKG